MGGKVVVGDKKCFNSQMRVDAPSPQCVVRSLHLSQRMRGEYPYTIAGASEAFINVREADNHLESLRYWHETTKHKLTPAQQEYIQCLYRPEGPRCPVVETKESLKEELEVAKELLCPILPDRCLFRCHLT